MSDKLVSVIVLVYQNYDVLFRSIISVLDQNYSRIELIVTDDGSDFFSKQSVVNYIEQNKNENLESYKIIEHKHNIGTVKNLNHALSQINGDYYITIGADDSLFNQNVISNFMSVFQKNNYEPYVVCGHMAMKTRDMKRWIRRFNSNEEVEILKRRNQKELFGVLSHKCIIPTVACCYSKKVVEQYKEYDTNYIYLEDWPLFLKMVREGNLPVFMDSYVSNHAAGGIANGSANYNTEILKKFFNDKQLMWQNEVYPYMDMLADKDKHLLDKRLKFEEKRLLMECHFWPVSSIDKLRLMIKKPAVIWWYGKLKLKSLDTSFEKLVGSPIDIFVKGLIMLIAFLLLEQNPNTLPDILDKSLKIVTAILSCLFIALAVISTLKKTITKVFKRLLSMVRRR